MFFERRNRWSLFSTVSLTAMAVGVQALANPANPVIVAGDVAISGLGTSQVVVDNGSMRSIVNWEEFSVGSGESTLINQVSNDAAILNRVTGGNMSEIYGSLTSNGRVYLINENGIVIGASGQVGTAGFVASTLDADDAQFLGGGDMVFSQGVSAGGGIEVHGKIRSVSGGDIFLLSREIEIGESAELSAEGTVGLGAGEEILLRPTDSGEGRISIRAGKGKIVNKGRIEAAAAELRAAGGNEYALAINNTGVVRATGVSKSGGKVVLTGGGKVRNTGKLVATKKVVVRSTRRIENAGEIRAADAAGKGGQIVMESPDIVLEAGSLLDVSAALGGGAIFIGGGYQGSGSSKAGEAVDISANAQSVSVAAGAVLDASATQSGDAGEIVVWSEGTTSFAGSAIADGGKGFIEISGREHIVYQGSVSAKGGMVLFDPGTVEIIADSDNDGIPDIADVNVTLGADADTDGIDDAFDVDGGATANSTTTGLATSVLTDRFVDSDIEEVLQAGADVTVSTSVGSGALGANEDIKILAGVRIEWSNDGTTGNGNATLTLTAARDINALDDVIIQNRGSGEVDTNEGGVFINAGRDINIGSATSRTGMVAIGSEFGQTNLSAVRDVVVRGADMGTGSPAAPVDHASAHVGFILAASSADDERNGTITINAGRDILVRGGQADKDFDARGNFAQIGHGGGVGATLGSDLVAAVNGDIVVGATGNLTVQGGADSASAAVIGHGAIRTNFDSTPTLFAGDGSFVQRDISGNISATAANISINTAYDPLDGSANAIASDTDSVIGRIGHGAIFTVVDDNPQSADITFGRIQGQISVTATGDLVVGTAQAPDKEEDRVFISSVIGHGSTGTLYFAPLTPAAAQGDTNQITHGDIMGFDTAADDDDDVDYGTNIAIKAGSTTVQSAIVSNDPAVENILRSQIGHTPTSVVVDAGGLAQSGHRIRIVESHIAGDILIVDTDKTDAKGVSAITQISSGADNSAVLDLVIARIGHAGAQFVDGLDGNGNGSNASSVAIYQAHILGANIDVDTLTQGSVATADDAVEGDNQDIKVTSKIAAGLTAATDNTAVSQIGHGSDARVRTGNGGGTALAADQDKGAGDGGDVTIARGTVWDGDLDDNDVATTFELSNTTDVTLVSSNQIVVDSGTAAATEAASRNASLAQIGHGFHIAVDSGDGGSAAAGSANGGSGGDVYVYQGIDNRDYGLGKGFDDLARGTRGNITLSARATIAGHAIEVTSRDASATLGTAFNSDYSQIGHSDLIEITTGDGGAGSTMGAGNTNPADIEGDDNRVIGQNPAYGGRGGHAIVLLGQVAQSDQYDAVAPVLVPAMEGNAGDPRIVNSARAGRSLTEGDISITAYGALLVESTVANATVVANNALTESVIGHGARIFAESGNGGAGGSGNFQANTNTVLEGEGNETFLSSGTYGNANRGGNGGDVLIAAGDITDRFIVGNNIRHDTDADNADGSSITITATDENGAHLADSLIIRSQVLAGTLEGTGADVNALVGHHVRLFGEGGTGGNGGSSNTEFDANGNSLFSDGTGQTDSTPTDGIDETAQQAGAVYIQPNSSGGRGGDVLLISNNIKGDIAVKADRRVTVETAAGHGSYSKVTSQIGHTTDLFAATQRGGNGGNLFEAPDVEATFDGGIVNVGGSQVGGNASTTSFAHVLVDGNQDDKFNLAGNGDADSTAGEDGIAVTAADIAARTGSTFTTIAADPVLGEVVEGKAPGATTGVIFHDEEADPQFILDASGNLVANNEANNTLHATDAANLARFGRVVATYDEYQSGEQGNDLNNLSLRVFVDMDRDGDVDLVDFDRDGRLDIVDLDHDGRMDQIDGRANYVVSGAVNRITGLGVLDYAAVTGKGFDVSKVEGGWTLRNELRTENLVAAKVFGQNQTDFTAWVGDFSTANGGRGGDAYTKVGYSSGDISVSTGNNDLGQATSLVVSVNLVDDPTAGGGYDYHRALIGHGAWQVSDAQAAMASYRAGREGIEESTEVHGGASGGAGGYYAVNASGGRGGNAFVVQGEARDNDADRDDTVLEYDHLVGHVWINTPNDLDNTNSGDAGRIDVTSFADIDYGNNFAASAIGHSAETFAYGGSGGFGASNYAPVGGSDGSSQTEIANGGDGGDASIVQHHAKGGVTVMTGADSGDGSNDVSLILKSENGAAITASGKINTLLSQIGHGRRATATGSSAGRGDDAQWLANGGNGGSASIVQNAILDAPVVIDLVDPARNYFGNGMLIAALDFHDFGDVVRAQVGHGDFVRAVASSGGDGTHDWAVNEQRNQQANGGNAGDASVWQAGYHNDITLDIGHNAAAGWALEIVASEANINDSFNDHTFAAVGHGGFAESFAGQGGNGGREGATNSLQTGTDPNLVDSDHNYGGSQLNGDTPYAIDASNGFHLGTDRRGGNGGNATLVMGEIGSRLGGREGLDYGVNDINGADITIRTNDALTAGGSAAGDDGIYIHAISGPGGNQGTREILAALAGHHGFGNAQGGNGGNGISQSLSSTITEGDGGDGGSATLTHGPIFGDVLISNVSGDALDDSGDTKSTNIIIEAVGGTASDVDGNRAEARAGHFTKLSAQGGRGGEASKNAGSTPSFPASLSAQGGDGGDAVTWQGQMEGDITLTAENSVIVRALDGMVSGQVTVAAVGHRQTAKTTGGNGGVGGTAAAEASAQSIYFIYEALRAFHARGNNFAALSEFEQKLVAPFVDYFANKPGELEVFLDRLVGNEATVIAANARDEDAVGGTNHTIAPLVSGDGHVAGANDGEIETMLHILAAAGHGGNAVIRQGSASLAGTSDILSASGNIAITALAFDVSDAARGYTQLASADALAAGMMLTHVGHQAEVYGAVAGNGSNLSGENADANGIGGDGGDAIADQYAVNGAIAIRSDHMISIRAVDSGPDAQEVRAYVGHRLNIGSDYTGYRGSNVMQAGSGGSESNDSFDDGRNGNGGDVHVWQRGVISGSDRSVGENGDFNTEISLAALEDADDHISIIIDAFATGPSSPDVETHIGHDFLLASAKAGDAGRQGALTGPVGASEGLLEGNGGDIFITQTDLGADIDIIGRDAVKVTSQTSTSGGNWANLTIGHQRSIGESADSDNPRSGSIIAGAGGDAHIEDVNASDLANADAAAQGFLEDADSGRIEISLGKLTDSRETNDDARMITITSITENVDVLSQTALGTSHLEIGNQQHVTALTLEAGDYSGDPKIQTAGDSGGVYIARDTISGDILLQALDADRTNSKTAADGKQVTVKSLANIGDAQVQVGHETEFTVTTGRSGFGELRDTFTGKLGTFAGLTNPTTVLDNESGQATIADAQNAVEDMEDLVRALALALRYMDRFPADDGVADANDAGDLQAAYNAAQTALTNARSALANIGSDSGQISVEQAVADVQAGATDLIAATTAFKTVLATIPQTGSLVADFADAGDIVYGALAPRKYNYGQDLNLGLSIGAVTLPANIADTGAVDGTVMVLSGRYTGAVADWRSKTIVGNDAIAANNFGGTGFTTADDIDDGVVHVEANTVLGVTLTEIGHRRFMVNTTGKGGGDTDTSPEEGGIAGDGGSIVSTNTTGGDVYLKAEEVVVTVLGAAGTSETHLGHSDVLANSAFWSDIGSLMGSGGDITNNTVVSGGIQIMAERIASSVDAKDRKLLATGLADSYLQIGHQVTTTHETKSDPIETGNLGDTQDNLGSNRGGRISSSQTVAGNNGALQGTGADTEGNGGDGIEDGVLVSILLDANGDGVEGDLIGETGGASPSRIRLGNAGQTNPAAGETSTATTTLSHTGISGANESDDGGAVTLTQRVGGDVVISKVEDLAIRVAGTSGNDIWIGHDATQIGVSGQTNAPAGTVPQYGERVTVNQAITGNLRFDPWSSFEASIGAASPGELHIGHEATQTAFSADDSGDPSDFDLGDSGQSAGGVNDGFARPDVLATQTVDADISITTGEILLSNANSTLLHVGHEAFHSAAADGDKLGVEPSRDGVQNAMAGLPSGFVVATSIINGAGSDIRFTATGATGQVDTVLVATNGTQGDITLEDVTAAGEVQVGHRSASTMSDNTPSLVAEGFYQTLQGIGSTTLGANGEAANTGNSVIAFNAAQDIELLDKIGGSVQVGHYIVENGAALSTTSPVAVNPGNAITDSSADSLLKQIVGSDILFGSNANQGKGGVGTGGAGNNLVMLTTGGRSVIGHMSPASNEWQVEGGARSVTQQLLDGDIVVEAGTDAGADLPNGATAGAGNETGTGDDIRLDATAGGVVRIGHNQSNTVEGVLNETQVSAGDIWVRAGGDLHVLAANVGHENYDFASSAAGKNNATPEGLAAGIRNRIRGKTTIGAGQNSAPEDSILIADIMKFDGTGGAVQVNSGYGGIGNKDVDGELRFFMPAQQNLTIVAPVTFNDSASNADAVTERTADATNVFEGTGGIDHEHPFAFMTASRAYTDAFVGAGNFTFYFEPEPRTGFLTTFYTPYIDSPDFNEGFSVVYRDEDTGAAVNSGVLGNGQVVGTGSSDIDCEDAGTDPEASECGEVVERYSGGNGGFGSNSEFPVSGGGNVEPYMFGDPLVSPRPPEDDQVSAYTISSPVYAGVRDASVTFALVITPPAAVTPNTVVASASGPAIVPGIKIHVPGQAIAFSTHAGSGAAAPHHFGEKTYGEYLRGGVATVTEAKRLFGPVISAAYPATVYDAEAL